MQASVKKNLIVGLIVLLALSRFIFPEADPAWWKSTDDIHDEAWWAENVRRMLLGEPWPGDTFARSWAVGPLTAVWQWMSFSAFGIHFFSLRLIALIPSTCAILLIYFKKLPVLEEGNRYKAALILALLPAFWSLSRIGHIEAMLSFIMLVCVYLSYSNKQFSWLLMGLLLLIGVLFKFSFAYTVVALFTWFLFRGISLKKIVTSGFIFLLGGCLVYLLYFIPNQTAFEPFYTYFSASFYKTSQLLDPRGWVLRLAWLHEKIFVTSPLNVILIAAFLVRIGQGKLPKRKTGIASLFAFLLVFLLFSDFSDRRLIVLLVLLPILLFEKHSGDSSPNTRYSLSWFFGLPLFIPFSKYTFFQDGNQLPELLTNVPIFIVFYTFFFWVIKWIFQKYIQNPSLKILQIGILFWISKAIYASAYAFEKMTHTDFLVSFILLSLVIALIVFNEWIYFDEKFRLATSAFLITLGFIFIVSESISPTYTIRDSAHLINDQCSVGKGIGPESLVELTILGNCSTELYLDVNNNTMDDSSKYAWFAGITTPLVDCDSLDRLFKQSAWMLLDTHQLSRKMIPVLPSPVGFKETVVIFN